MPTAIPYAPLALDFGGVAPSSAGPDIAVFSGDLPSDHGGVKFADVALDGDVTAFVTGDTDRFRVRDVFVLDWIEEFPDPDPDVGDGPPPGPGHGGGTVVHHRPPPVKVLEVVAQGDGTQPLHVATGQTLLVRVQYQALARDGAYAGTLCIRAPGWADVDVPLSLFLTDVRAEVLDTMSIAQGGIGALPVRLRSVAGPAVDVRFSMSVTQLHNGLTMVDGLVPQLQPGETRDATLSFSAASDAPLGHEDVAIVQTTFFPMGLFVGVDIVPAQLVVNPASPNRVRVLRRGTPFQLAVSVSLSGGSPADITFTGDGLPPGVSLQARSFFIEQDQVVVLDGFADAATPDECDFGVAWTGGIGGTQSGRLGYHLTVPRPIVLSGTIESGGLAALGGWWTVTLDPDGATRWQGHAHDSGADGYDFNLSVMVRAPGSGRAIVFHHAGHVGGTFTSGDRDHDWDEATPAGTSSVLARDFDDFAAAGHADSHLEYTSDLGTALEGALTWLAKFAAGTVAGPVVGAVVLVGAEAVSFFTTGSLVPGARIVENILWMAGPENTLFALVADGIARVGSRERALSDEEYAWANGMASDQAQVFAGCLPPQDKLVLTDTIGAGNRAFTFPRFDGMTTLNLGPDGYDDPRRYSGAPGTPDWGATLVHELVHACQIAHSNALPLLADALASKVCELEGGDPYVYGPPSDDYRHWNLEQQAQAVSDWFRGRVNAWYAAGKARDPDSPYFHFLDDNVRPGFF